MRELLPENIPCVVVLFVRRQDRWIDSYFNQLVKTNDIDADNISTFVARLCDTEGERLCRPDWYTTYEAWRNAFGNCQVVFYDEVASDVFETFLAAARLEPVPALIEIDRVQVSLDVYELAYLLNLQMPIAFPDFIQRRAASDKATRRLGRQQVRSFLTDADLARLRNRFAASNQRLLTTLGRSPNQVILQLDVSSESDSYAELREVCSSAGFARFRKLADSIYERRRRRRRWGFR